MSAARLLHQLPHPKRPPAGLSQAAVEARILWLLSKRQAGATLCPSKVARSFAQAGETWREWMPHIRDVAQAFVRAGLLTVTGQGVPVVATAPGRHDPVGKDCRVRRDAADVSHPESMVKIQAPLIR